MSDNGPWDIDGHYNAFWRAEFADAEPETEVSFTCPVCHRLEWETEREAAECCVRHTPGFASMLANRCKEITGCPNGRAE